MSIFQKSILNKYLKNLDNDKISKAYESFKSFYGNKLRLYEILHLKEENYQEGFLREIFVQSLGYTIRPDLDYNLTTEYKNQTDSKKADGAIIRDNSAIGVIELKSAKTFNLDSIRNQAFNYKNNQPDCRYVITSNFRLLRFYIDNATEFEEFNLFELTIHDFRALYLLLSWESISKDIPLKMKEETKFHEENISEKFYKDYKQFRDKIFNNLIKNNPQYDKLTLFKKTQKLLDRFIFIWFAEDCGLVSPNLIAGVIQKWKNLLDNDEYFSLYSRFQKTFRYLDTGYTFQNTLYPAFNGGLFHPDDIIDNPNLKIDDDVLLEDCLKISAYDFSTELDVNILGHIFEHSLNEIEEISAELLGETIDKSKTKRKKDGVFYTPKYITNYIVESTIGKLCLQKKEELNLSGLENIEGLKDKKGKLTKQGKELFQKLQEYKKWLLGLKILDPACGSGAFLNAALDYLINEHKGIDDQISDLTGDKMRIFDTDKSILENNIFGVDINEESVEIAKLSLWLRTARKDRKLSDLNGNLKCGNSLIHAKEIAGEKAFDWSIEFPEIMQNGGFDVVIGNPPYVNIELLSELVRKYLLEDTLTCFGRTDIYIAFIEKAVVLLKNDGLFSFIIPFAYTNQNYGERSRKFLAECLSIISITDFSNYNVFEDAKVKSIILTVQRNNKNKFTEIRKVNEPSEIVSPKTFKVLQEDFLNLKSCRFETRNIYILDDLKKKIDDKSVCLSKICFVAYGARLNEKKTTNGKDKYIHQDYQEGYKPFLEGKNIERYYYSQFGWLNYKPKEHYNSMFPELFENEKIVLIRIIKDRIRFAYDNSNFYNSHTVINCVRYDKLISINHVSVKNEFRYNSHEFAEHFDYKFLLAILNSKLMNWYFVNFLSDSLNFYPNDVKQMPIPDISIEQQADFIDRANLLIENYKLLNETVNEFSNYLIAKHKLQKITANLKSWHLLDEKIFLDELKRNKIKLETKEEVSLLKFFKEQRDVAKKYQQIIFKTDNEIDNLVYNLYKLSKDEIALVC